MMATMLAWDFLLHLPTTKWPTTSTGKQQSIDKRLACFVFFCCIVNQTDLGENKRNGIVFQLAGTPGRSSAPAPKKKNPPFVPLDRGADGPELWFKLPLKTLTKALDPAKSTVDAG